MHEVHGYAQVCYTSEYQARYWRVNVSSMSQSDAWVQLLL